MNNFITRAYIRFTAMIITLINDYFIAIVISCIIILIHLVHNLLLVILVKQYKTWAS